MKRFIIALGFLALAAQASAQYTLSIQAFGNGSVNISPAPDVNGTHYTPGTVVTAIAIPADQWKLDYWQSGATILTADTITVKMNQDRAANVFFVKGTLLYFGDETFALASIAKQVRDLFEQTDKVRNGAEYIVINDTLTIVAPFEALGGANLTLIRDKMTALLDSVVAISDTLKAIVQQ